MLSATSGIGYDYPLWGRKKKHRKMSLWVRIMHDDRDEVLSGIYQLVVVHSEGAARYAMLGEKLHNVVDVYRILLRHIKKTRYYLFFCHWHTPIEIQNG